MTHPLLVAVAAIAASEMPGTLKVTGVLQVISPLATLIA